MSEYFQTTPLYTSTGDFVADVRIPPITPPVEAIIWGVRMFVRQTDGRYFEGLSYVVFDVVNPQQAVLPIRFNP